MILNSIQLLNFKNIVQSEIFFSDGINCIVGSNGSGKTNLIDAIYYLSFCKSFVNPIDTHNVNFNSDYFMIQGRYQWEDREDEVLCSVKRGQKKIFKRNKKEYERLSEHIGAFPLVVISPSDELLINGHSEERRRYMDSVISQFDHHYLNLIIRYARIVMQRNALLKKYDQQVTNAFLDVYDAQLLEIGTLIHKKRQRFMELVQPLFSKYYALLTDQNEEVGINYISHLASGQFSVNLGDSRERDIRYGYTTIGIHRDELDFILSGNLLKKYGSQGQKKSFLIALKLAHFELIYQELKVAPMLLLDDVFDKLDSFRGDNLIQLVSSSLFKQIFITDTQKERLISIVERTGKPYKVFDVKMGEISSVN